MLSFSSASWRLALWGGAVLFAWGGFAQSAISPQGGEYAIAASLPGDQVFARAAVGPSGGYIVWHDNFIDGDGLGIGARRLDRSFAGTLGSFRINAAVEGEQEYPQVALFPDGGAVVVWQGGPLGFPKIYARFLGADGTFTTGDLRVSSDQPGRQEHPQVAVLSDGTAVAVWTCYGQDGSLDGVFAQRLSRTGVKLGEEFLVTQRTQLNQRSPAIAALPEGAFVIVWVSEKENRVGSVISGQEGYAVTGPGRLPEPYDVSVYGRLFNTQGALGDEFKVNVAAHVAANPAVCAVDGSGFVVAWSAHVGRVTVNGVQSSRGWDVFARGFALDGTALAGEQTLNERTLGDQFLPALSAYSGTRCLVAWISLGQDGNREGIVARPIDRDATPLSGEMIVNETTAGPQKLPAVASDLQGRCLVTWSGARGGVASFDLFGRRYSNSDVLVAPAKPFVTALSSSRLSVTWPDLSELGIQGYEVYADGSTTPIGVEVNYWTATKLAAGSTHNYRLAYVLKDGRKSPLSEAATGVTWGEDEQPFDGLPDDWQAKYWGPDFTKWPEPSADSDGDGASNLQEFMAGTDPTDPTKVLRLTWIQSKAGMRLSWNTEKGCIYQVQESQDLKRWDNVGQARFAAGTTDSVPANPASGKAVYRVVRLR